MIIIQNERSKGYIFLQKEFKGSLLRSTGEESSTPFWVVLPGYQDGKCHIKRFYYGCGQRKLT